MLVLVTMRWQEAQGMPPKCSAFAGTERLEPQQTRNENDGTPTLEAEGAHIESIQHVYIQGLNP